MTTKLTTEEMLDNLVGRCTGAGLLGLIPDILAIKASLGVDEPDDEPVGLRLPGQGLVCTLCLFVGQSDDPEPITIINGQLTCEPHNGYFQGGDQTQAIIAWRKQHPDG